MTDTAPLLTELVVANIALLQAVDEGGHESTAALARSIGRDKSNVTKSLKLLAAEGYLENPAGTDGVSTKGREALAAWRRAHSAPRVGSPQGDDGAPSNEDANATATWSQIDQDPENARADWDSDEAREELRALADSIREHGLLQPLVVKVRVGSGGGQPPSADQEKCYRLVAGERRWRAIKLLIDAGDLAPDWPIPITVFEGDDEAARVAGLIENLQRRDLNPLEKALAFEALAATHDNAAIAELIGKTPEHVQQHRRLLKLTEAERLRLTLPRDDNRRLTLREARTMLADRDRSEEERAARRLPPDQLLALTELAHRAATQSNHLCHDQEVSPALHSSPLVNALTERGLVWTADEPATWGKLVGRYVARVSWSARRILDDHDIKIDIDADAALARAYEIAFGGSGGERVPALERDEDGTVRYLLTGLNGPFEITPEGQALIDEQAEREAAVKARRSADAEQRQRLEAKGEAARAQAVALARRTAPAKVPEPLFAEIAATAEHPLPWRVYSDASVLDSEGHEVFEGPWQPSDSQLAVTLLMVTALNAAAGHPTADIHEPEAVEIEDEADPGDESEAA